MPSLENLAQVTTSFQASLWGQLKCGTDASETWKFPLVDRDDRKAGFTMEGQWNAVDGGPRKAGYPNGGSERDVVNEDLAQ